MIFAVMFTSLPGIAEVRIYVPAKLNGRPLHLSFDTGSEGLLLFDHAARRFGLRITTATKDQNLGVGKVAVATTEPVRVELLGTIFESLEIGVVTLPPWLDMDIDGVIGWNSLRGNTLLLNGRKHEFYPLAELPPETTNWTRLRLIQDCNLFAAELPDSTPGKPQRLGIDTGWDGGLSLSNETWDKWQRAHPQARATLDAYYTPGTGLVVSPTAWADEIEIGGLVFRDVPLHRLNPTESANYPTHTAVVVGLFALLGTDSIFDGKSGHFYLRPSEGPSRPFPHNRLGAVFVPPSTEESDDLVAHVAADSPAAKAGIHDGDVLLRIDQLDVTPWRTKPGILPFSRFFDRPAGTKLTLVLRRGNQRYSVDVTLRDIIGPAAKAGIPVERIGS